jgi:hypothetical protein
LAAVFAIISERGISDKNVGKLCRGTATSAIWKVTYWQWLTTFAPILTSYSHNLPPAAGTLHIPQRAPLQIAELSASSLAQLCPFVELSRHSRAIPRKTCDCHG